MIKAKTIPPHVPFTRDELLILLIEECGEVIQAATKCLRFGFDTLQLNYGQNSVVLAEEVGDLQGVLDVLPLDVNVVAAKRAQKIARAAKAKEEIGVRHQSSRGC